MSSKFIEVGSNYFTKYIQQQQYSQTSMHDNALFPQLENSIEFQNSFHNA